MIQLNELPDDYEIDFSHLCDEEGMPCEITVKDVKEAIHRQYIEAEFIRLFPGRWKILSEELHKRFMEKNMPFLNTMMTEQLNKYKVSDDKSFEEVMNILNKLDEKQKPGS